MYVRLGHAAAAHIDIMGAHHSGGTESMVRDFDSTLDSVDAAEALVVKIAEEHGFEEDDLHQIGMAVREAMVNAVVHGNRYNLKKKVHMSVESSGSRLEIVITDEGDGYEPQALPDPLAEENLLRQSGRGLLLIQAFVDEFDMRRVEPRGTRVHLVKDRSKQ